MCTAYQMVTPGQPDSGGTIVGVSPVLCYNPWLESGFGPSVLLPVNGLIPNPNYGVQTNCMSCHALARYPHGGFLEFYTANQYIDIGPSLSDALRVDFTWSVPVNASVPTVPAPNPIPIPYLPYQGGKRSSWAYWCLWRRTYILDTGARPIVVIELK